MRKRRRVRKEADRFLVGRRVGGLIEPLDDQHEWGEDRLALEVTADQMQQKEEERKEAVPPPRWKQHRRGDREECDHH